MASPSRYSRYRSDATESDTSRPSARLGMSEYTSQRLAELRARRAEMEMNDGSKTAEAITTSGGSSINSSSSSLSSLSKDKDKESPTHSSSTSSTPSRNYRQTETTTSNITPASSSPTPAPRSTYKTTTDIMKERETEIKTMSLDRNIEPKAAKNGHDDGDDFVGFSSLPEQVHRKAVKRGFDFTLMVVGESGLGKSTLVNSLFLTDLYKDRKMPKVEERVAKTVQIDKKFVEFEEKGVRLRLTIVDTPGFSDSINAEECWKSIESYVNQQFNQYLKDESGLNRRNIKDGRVHCCLYFVSPYGHGLRQLDVKFMKQLHDKVNIVPVIAKADCLTHKEIFKLKEKILDEIEKYKIQIYEFPECDSDEDDDFKKQDSELKAAIPFAVIGSNTVIDVGGKKIRGRQYPWGIVEVDNPKHCDFAKLRQMLISTHMQDLKEVTRDIHYENFRARQLAEQLSTQQRERTKLKRESQNLDAGPDADRLLQQKDEEIRRMQEMIAKMQRQLGNNNLASVNGLGNL